MSDPLEDFVTAAAVAYVDAYAQWRHAESRLSEALERHKQAQEDCNRARVKALNGKAFLLEVTRKHQ